MDFFVVGFRDFLGVVCLSLVFFRPYSVSLIPKMIQLHGCH